MCYILHGQEHNDHNKCSDSLEMDKIRCMESCSALLQHHEQNGDDHTTSPLSQAKQSVK